MREKFEQRRLTGRISIKCKYENAPTRVWETTKQEVISHIRQIVSSYANQGYRLTLRQLHYQLVTRNWIINHDSAYKKLGDILDDCRYAGLIDWDMIEDRGRRPYIEYSVRDIEHALTDTVEQYKLDRQRGQTNVVELWTEKDALSGIFSRTTDKYHVRLVVNKGYTSSSALYRAYERIVQSINEGKRATILYFGDHDPSGLDMVRDIRDRLTKFLCNGNKFNDDLVQAWWDKRQYTIYDVIQRLSYEAGELLEQAFHTEDEEALEVFYQQRRMWFMEENELFRVNHIGLTMEQIEMYNLPPNPTKLTDSRAESYIRKHGRTCWEVDALSPEQLTNLVEDHIQQEVDIPLYESVCAQEQEEIQKLNGVIVRLDEILNNGLEEKDGSEDNE